MLVGDVRRDGKAQAGSVFLGGEERIEDSIPILRRDAGALVADFDAHTSSEKKLRIVTWPPSLCGLDRVENEIE